MFRWCKPTLTGKNFSAYKRDKSKEREVSQQKRASCRTRGHKQSMDEKRARFSTKKGQEYSVTTGNTQI